MQVGLVGKLCSLGLLASWGHPVGGCSWLGEIQPESDGGWPLELLAQTKRPPCISGLREYLQASSPRQPRVSLCKHTLRHHGPCTELSRVTLGKLLDPVCLNFPHL